MKTIIAPDSFKGCLSATEVAEALAEGVRRADPEGEILAVPLADGGEGTVDALVSATKGRLIRRTVEGPLGDPVEATFGLLGDGSTAVVEMAAASGLPLVPPERRDPTRTSTYGTGQLLQAALELGAEQIIVGIGGSATNDCGCGMAQALGVRFYDAQGREIERVTGGRLLDVARIDASGIDPRLAAARIRVACDVDNPLYGPRGAAHVYAPQKGATPEQVELLDRGLRHLAEVIERDLGISVAEVPGAGAAGGLGAGLLAFCGATLEPGVEIVMDAVGLAGLVHKADLVISAEGRVDEQTAYGKTPAGVARVGREAGVPTVVLGGSVPTDPTVVQSLCRVGFVAVLSIMAEPMRLEAALDPQTTRRQLALAGEAVVRLFLAGRQAGPK